MDRSILKDLLANAEAHIVQSEQHISRQLQIIAILEYEGQDLSEPRKLLDMFEELRAEHVADRAQILKDLHNDDAAPGVNGARRPSSSD